MTFIAAITFLATGLAPVPPPESLRRLDPIIAAHQPAVERPTAHRASRGGARHRAGTAQSSGGRCGGDLPPCSVMRCESGGNLRAENPSSSASGKWQIVDGTWDGYGGYRHAADAPESVQDAKARELYAGGRGRGQWVCR